MTVNRDLVVTRDLAVTREKSADHWSEPELSHWAEADRESHEKPGFAEGWGVCSRQPATPAARL